MIPCLCVGRFAILLGMAIAFDKKTEFGFKSGAVRTVAHACTGSDGFLFISATTANWTTGNPTSVSANYNGVAVTRIAQNIQVFPGTPNWRTHSFYLKAPSSGLNDLVVTAVGGNGIMSITIVSYSGVDQTSPVLTSNISNSIGSGNIITIPLTTAEDAWWIISGTNVDDNWNSGGLLTPTLRAGSSTGLNGIADSNGIVTAQTGNARMSFTGTRGYGGTAIAFKPAASGPPTPTYTITCDPASFTTTGTPTNILARYRLQAQPASFTLTGQAANILKRYRLACETGVFALTGNVANILGRYRIATQTAQYSLTGKDVSFLRRLRIACGTGAFALTGQNASLLARYTIAVQTAVFTLTASPAGILARYRIGVEPGTFAVTGNDATIEKVSYVKPFCPMDSPFSAKVSPFTPFGNNDCS